jgi:hypothetical protein
MQKGFAPLVLLIVVLTSILIGTIGYFFWYSPLFKTKNTLQSNITVKESTVAAIPKKQTQEYINQIGQFSLQIDPKYQIVEESEADFYIRSNGDMRKNFTSYIKYSPEKFVSAVFVLDTDQSYEKAPLTIWVSENSDNLNESGYFNKYWYYPFVWGDFTNAKNKIAPETEEIIDGKIGYSGVVNYRPANPKFIYLQNKGKMYLFRLVGDTDILKGFKFTN